jgi:RHS repeat-associated protein
LAASPNEGIEPLTVSFDGSRSWDPDGRIVSYRWDFGDGSSAKGPQVTHTYLSAGTYSAQLTVKDDGGRSATARTDIVVRSAVDVVAPVWPDGAVLEVLERATSSVRVAWPEASDAVGLAGYRVFVDGAEVGSVDLLTREFVVPGLEPGTEYGLQVEAFDAAGNASDRLGVLVRTLPVVDESAPVWPDGAALEASEVGVDRLQLVWPPASDDVGVTGYRLYRDGELLAELGADVGSFDVVGLEPGTDYLFRVTAGDAAGNWNDGLELTVRSAVDVVAPVWPDGAVLEVLERATSSVRVAWPEASDAVGLAGYRVFVDGAEVGSVDLLTREFVVPGLEPGTEYGLQVEAFDAAGNASDRLGVLVRTLPVVDESAPVWPDGAALEASEVGVDRLQLVWPPASDDVGVTGYRLYRDGELLAELGADVGSFDVVGLEPGTDYLFRVTAGDAAGNWNDGLELTVRSAVDVVAPVWPDGAVLEVLERATSSVRVAWPEASDQIGVLTYEVTVDGATAAELPSDQLSFEVENLDPGTDYRIGVVAVDATGNSSTPLTVDTSTVPLVDTSAPTFPTGAEVRVGNREPTSVEVAWDPAEDDTAVIAYRVFADGVLAATTEAADRSATVVGLPVDTPVLIGIEAGDGAGNWSRRLERRVRTTSPPPDLPELPPTPEDAITAYADSVEFLYSGAAPVQTGVEPDAIVPERVAVVRGHARDEAGDPLPGVTVTAVGRPEFGSTTTRSSGEFDLAVNGGARYTLRFTKDGYLPADRPVTTTWNDFSFTEDITLVKLDEESTTVDTSDSTEPQVVRGSVESDANGSRQATLVLPEGTSAEMVMSDGSTEPLESATIRATEFTTGEDGLDSMPAPLPPSSAYTYAVELSVDEAIEAGAASVRFDEPVSFYVENFLEFPVGGIVPVGSYDRQSATWVAEPNGRVIEIVGIESGSAQVDIDGDGVADAPAALAGLGIDGDELRELAELYEVGTSLWRVEVSHFTPWDCNWPFGPPDGADGPDGDADGDGEPDEQCENSGSIIGCEGQTLGEAIALTGSPHVLRYDTRRAAGYEPGRISVPLTGTDVPPGLKRVDVEITVDGRRYTESFEPQPNQSYQFDWNQLDAYGRPAWGVRTAAVRTGYVYDVVYRTPADFARSFAAPPGIGVIGNRGRGEVTYWRDSSVDLVARSTLGPGDLGGWTFTDHHVLDPRTGTLFQGDATTEKVADRLFNGYAVRSLTGLEPSTWAEGRDAGLLPGRPVDVAAASDGSVVVADAGTTRSGVTGDGRFPAVRRVGIDGRASTVMGGKPIPALFALFPAYPGDGVRASDQPVVPQAVGVRPDGTVVVAALFYDDRVRDAAPHLIEVDDDGQTSLLAGPIELGLPSVVDLEVASDGTLLVGGDFAVKAVAPDGAVTPVAGTGLPPSGTEAVGGPAETTSIWVRGIGVSETDRPLIATTSGNVLALDAAGTIRKLTHVDGLRDVTSTAGGSLLLARSLIDGSGVRNQVLRFRADGVQEVVAGRVTSATNTEDGDGVMARNAAFLPPDELAVTPDGSLLVLSTDFSSSGRVRRVAPGGIVHALYGYNPGTREGLPAQALPTGLFDVTGVGPDGSIYLATPSAPGSLLRRITPEGRIGALPIQQTWVLPILSSGDVLYVLGGEIRKLRPDGSDVRIAGSDEPLRNYGVDGAPALDTSFARIDSVAEASDGSVYFTETFPDGDAYGADAYTLLRRIDPSGIISTVAGRGTSAEAGPASALRLTSARHLATDSDGSVYWAEGATLWQMSQSGFAQKLAEGKFTAIRDVEVNGSGAVFVIGQSAGTTRYRIFRLLGNEPLAIAGSLDAGPSLPAEGTPALQARIDPRSMAIAPNGDIAFADSDRVRALARPTSVSKEAEFLVPSEDGAVVYVFDARGRHLRTLDAITNTVLLEFGYRADGLLETMTDPFGNTTRIDRNAEGVPISVTGPYGQQDRLTIVDGQLLALTNPADETFEMSYWDGGLLKTFDDPKDNRTRFFYTDRGRLREEVDASGASTTLTRETVDLGYQVVVERPGAKKTIHRVQRLQDGTDRRTTVYPSATSRVVDRRADGTVEITSPEGTVVRIETSPDPRWGDALPYPSRVTTTQPSGLSSDVIMLRTAELASPDDPLSATELFSSKTSVAQSSTAVYDSATRTLTEEVVGGPTSVTKMDEFGRITESAAVGGPKATYSFDARGRLKEASSIGGSLSRTIQYGYDQLGRVETITDPALRTKTLAYDQANRVQFERLPGATGFVEVGYGFDAAGNLDAVTPPGRPAHEYVADTRNLPAEYRLPPVNGESAVFRTFYNPDMTVDRVEHPTGENVDFDYDQFGRWTNTTFPGESITRTYDTADRIKTTTAGQLTETNTYDGTLLTGATRSGATEVNTSVANSLAYAHDQYMRVSEWSVPGFDPVSISYDAANRLSGVADLSYDYSPTYGKVDGTSIGTVETRIGRNDLTEVTSETTTANDLQLLAINLERDEMGRIERVNDTTSATATETQFKFNPRGFLEEVREGGVVRAAYGYDANGNRNSVKVGGTEELATFDERDRLKTRGSLAYSYDQAGRLSKIVDTATSATTSYDYDAGGFLRSVDLSDGREVSYEPDPSGNPASREVDGTWTHKWFYAGGINPIGEERADGTRSLFVYAGENAPSLMVRDGRTYRFITDYRGSVRLVIDTASGAVAQELTYDAWGRILSDSAPGFQPFAFGGGVHDPDTGLTRFGARDYDPEAARWTSPDPMGFSGGDVNLYAYVGNDPINQVDPSGLFIETFVDVLSCGIGLGQVASELASGCGVDGWNVAFTAFDCASIFLPGVPGVAGLAGRAIRYSDEVVQYSDDVVDAGRRWGDDLSDAGRRSGSAPTGSGGVRCSFSADTLVLMADGTKKPISEVRAGDYVRATDPETGETGPREVIATLPHLDKLLTLETSSGEVVTTEDHRYWNATDREWQESQHLGAGDQLLTANGDRVTVKGIDWTSALSDAAYDLDIADLDTFYVGVGEAAVLVHNTNPCGTPYGAGGEKPPRAPSYRSTDGGMSATRDAALDRANAALAGNQSGRLRLEDGPTEMHIHVDVYNNRGELLETIHFPYQRR